MTKCTCFLIVMMSSDYMLAVIVTVGKRNPQRITMELWRGSDNDMVFQHTFHLVC